MNEVKARTKKRHDAESYERDFAVTIITDWLAI